jgi:prepilin-type N-terminal cleavage/methylation domain-containing protein
VNDLTVSLERFPRAQRGFTLIEITIVLVIIGLLIGGILAAQSMIRTARNQKLLQTMQQYMVAARNFKTAYNYWPGDKPGPEFGCAGNGNDVVEFHSSGPQNCIIGGQPNYEGSNFFVQLSLANFIPATLSYNTTIDPSLLFVPGVNVPAGMEKNSMFVVQSTLGLWNNDVVANARCLGFCDARTAGETASGVSYLFYTAAQGASYPSDTRHLVNILKPAEAYYSDMKIDDGMPNSGNVIGSLGGQLQGEPFDTSCAMGTGNPYMTEQFQLGEPYNLSSNRKVCVLGFKLTNDAY